MEDLIEHRAARPALERADGFAIERVFADVEIERRQIVRTEIKELVVNLIEVVCIVGAAHEPVEFGKPVKHIKL